MADTTQMKHIEVLGTVDRWIHWSALAGGLGAIVTGPLLQSPGITQGIGIEKGLLSLVHGLSAFIAVTAWIMHLGRVSLAWLEGKNPWGLLPRPRDLSDFIKGLLWSIGIAKSAPLRLRFSYRERFSYIVIALLTPVISLTGLSIAQPERFYSFVGADGIMALASLHSILGYLLTLALFWHIYFAMLQPGVLWFNSSFITGRLTWDKLCVIRPEWSRVILGEVVDGLIVEDTEEESVSVEELLHEGNEAARAKNYPEAVRLYKEALELYPGYPQALYNLGVALLRTKDLSGSREALTAFLAQDSFGPTAKRARELVAGIERIEREMRQK